jgi:hypothetical protein
VLAIAKSLLRLLIDRNDDRLDVVIAIALRHRSMADFGKGLDPGRIIGVVVVPFQLSYDGK